MSKERLYLSVLEYFLEEDVKKIVIDDFIEFFTNEYDVFFELFFETSVKSTAGLVRLNERLVNDTDFRRKGENYAADRSNLKVNTYVEDGGALTEYLCKTFRKKKIYLLGESWGSALGIFLAEKYPERYYAFVGTGQMIDFVDTEKYDYEKAIEIAQVKNDNKTIKKLRANGVPPYYGTDVTWKSAVYLNYLSSYMQKNPEIYNSGYNTITQTSHIKNVAQSIENQGL